MRTRLVLFITLSFLALPLSAQEIFATIQFPGEKAEAISSFSWGVSQTRSSTGEGGDAGRVVFSDVSFTKPVTQLSGALFLGCISGKHFSSVVVTVAKKKGKDKKEPYLTYTLSDVVVSSYSVSGREGSTTDTITLTYDSIDYTLIDP